MIRMKPVPSGKRAEDYYSATDGGYYLESTGLRRQWVGAGAPMLGLVGPPEIDQYKNLVHGRHPSTGEQLTAALRDNRIPAWDVTASVPKEVTQFIEAGDERIQPALWRAVERTVARLERYATTRVRKDNQQEDRATGILVGYAVEHPDTRPVEDKSLPEDHKWRVMPQPDRHIHVVIFNVTWDEEEQRWKAVKFRPIMDLRRFFDRVFDAEMAAEMADLGYAVEPEFREDSKGNLKYHTYRVEGMPESLRVKRSARSREIDRLEQEIVAGRQRQDKYAPDHLTAVEKDKLGATSRRLKRDDLTLSECREYWASQETEEESAQVADAIGRAKLGLNPRPEPAAAQAVAFAMRHHFETEAAVPVETLATTALEQAMGGARLGDIEREMARQGVIIVEKDGKRLATTEALQQEELDLAAYAMDGRGKALPIGVADGLARRLASGETLNDGQWDAALGLLRSANRVEVVMGPAGAGKSKLLKKFDEGARLAGQTVTYLGTTSAAVKVLQKDGFAANTVARFLLDERMQRAAQGGRVVIDETSILGHKEAVELFRVARERNLKLIFVGDPMQHGSIGRGAFMRLLVEHGRIKPFRLTEILRQEDPAYRAAAQLLSEGKAAEGFDALDKLGWVTEMPNAQDRYTHMAADYVRALQGGTKWNDVLVVSPTHAEAAGLTREIRSQLRGCGRLGADERTFTRLVPVEASEAERGLASTYRAGDVIQFHQNAKGGFTKGQRLVVTDPARLPLAEAGKFSVYRGEKMALAEGDILRFTGTVHTLGRDQTIKNGEAHAVAGFTEAGNIRLDNGWVISGREAGHFRHGVVETSIGSQGRTVKRVILGMSTAMGRAVSMQQLYVSASRARQSLRIYLDDREAVREEAQRDSRKLLALDLLPQADARDRLLKHLERERRLALLKKPFRYTSALLRPDPPAPPLTHAARHQARQQHRDHHHAR